MRSGPALPTGRPDRNSPVRPIVRSGCGQLHPQMGENAIPSSGEREAGSIPLLGLTWVRIPQMGVRERSPEGGILAHPFT